MRRLKMSVAPISVVQSMAQASAMLGVSQEVLSRAKKMGCLGFGDGGRIKIQEVRQFISEHADEFSEVSDTSPKEEKLRQEIRKLKNYNDAREDKVVERVKVARDIKRVALAINKILTQKLEQEYPVAVAGLQP